MRRRRDPTGAPSTPAVRPEIVRSCPAVAVETSKSAATEARIGVSVEQGRLRGGEAQRQRRRRRVTLGHQTMIGTVPPSALHAAPVT